MTDLSDGQNVDRPTSQLARQSIFAFAIALAFSIVGNNALSQGWPVYDNASFLKRVADFAVTVEHYKSQVENWRNQISHYEQQLTRLTKMDFRLPKLQNQYSEISPQDSAELVAQKCPQPNGISGVTSSLLQIVTPAPEDHLVDNIQKNCEQIKLRQIDKYNLTVKMMSRLQDYAGKAQQIIADLEHAGDTKNQGDLAGVLGNFQASQTSMDTEMRLWQAQMSTDDELISFMQNQQSDQAQQLMRGKKTVWGTVIQAGVFAGALK